MGFLFIERKQLFGIANILLTSAIICHLVLIIESFESS